MEDAFSKILLVVLSTGKVHVEVNTTVEERIHLEEGLETESYLKVSLVIKTTYNNYNIINLIFLRKKNRKIIKNIVRTCFDFIMQDCGYV